jgi:hypothetical protein
VVSLLYQARDGRNAREQTTRTLQLELLRMAMDDPSLMTAGGAPWDLDIPSDSASIREFLYIQMWVSFLAGNYTIGELPESSVRHLAAHELFRSRAGRNYWRAVRQSQIENSIGRRKHFFRTLDDEYKKTISSGVPVASPVRISKHPDNSKTIQHVCMIAGAAIIGTLAGRLWRHGKH